MFFERTSIFSLKYIKNKIGWWIKCSSSFISKLQWGSCSWIWKKTCRRRRSSIWWVWLFFFFKKKENQFEFRNALTFLFELVLIHLDLVGKLKENVAILSTTLKNVDRHCVVHLTHCQDFWNRKEKRFWKWVILF